MKQATQDKVVIVLIVLGLLALSLLVLSALKVI